ncbi:hypothetical protein [Morganella morganii]|uniref:hypothetical protein n=1 Tax=Morganella morganii TaxID=582 RepID=UPI0034D428F3
MSDAEKMTNEQFVLYVFDKTVDLFGRSYFDPESAFTEDERDKFDKIYRFLANRLHDRLEDQKITVEKLNIPEL